MSISEKIIALVNKQGATSLSLIKLQGDASSRQYFRVTTTDGSLIACYDPAFIGINTDEYPFLIMQQLLRKHAIPVPTIIAMEPTSGLLLLEDCGDLLLQNVVAEMEEEALSRRYREILDILVQLQAIKGNCYSIPFSLSFDYDKLMFEFDFFIEHGLRNYFAKTFDSRSIDALRHEFEAITNILVKPKHFVLNHRDFHSRNILLHHNKPVVIDFQDARMGLPQYDAVSLLRDSYVTLPATVTDELTSYHYQALCTHNATTMSFDEYLYYFDISAFQRNMKAIGTFCYQTQVKRNNSFEHSIAPTLAYLHDYINARQELRAAGNLLQPLFESVTP